jgi:hypothetical protein
MAALTDMAALAPRRTRECARRLVRMSLTACGRGSNVLAVSNLITTPGIPFQGRRWIRGACHEARSLIQK